VSNNCIAYRNVWGKKTQNTMGRFHSHKLFLLNNSRK